MSKKDSESLGDTITIDVDKSSTAQTPAAGIVHRDLKPGNVLIEKSTGRIVLTDFGIARGLVEEAGQHRTVGTVGTPLYMAPEQVRGGTVDARTDLYALGLVLYEMVTGK